MHTDLRNCLWTSVLAAFICFGTSIHVYGAESDLNASVLNFADSMKDGGGYLSKAYREADETKHVPGVPDDVVIDGKTIYEKVSEGSYCSGFTIAMVFFALDKADKLPDGLATTRRAAFQRTWFGSTESSQEKQCVKAMVDYGIGKGVGLKDAKAGDFVQYFRKDSGYDGHSAVVKEILVSGPQIIGMRIRSSQKKVTNGVGDRVVLFNDVDALIVDEYKDASPDRAVRKRTYLGRLTVE